jgi:hypothetical protein
MERPDYAPRNGAQGRDSTMLPVRLSDDELNTVMQAAAPLAVAQRDPFLRAVANSLAGYKEIGPGTVFTVCRELQKQFFDPPNLEHAGTGKYARGG